MLSLLVRQRMVSEIPTESPLRSVCSWKIHLVPTPWTTRLVREARSGDMHVMSCRGEAAKCCSFVYLLPLPLSTSSFSSPSSPYFPSPFLLSSVPLFRWPACCSVSVGVFVSSEGRRVREGDDLAQMNTQTLYITARMRVCCCAVHVRKDGRYYMRCGFV